MWGVLPVKNFENAKTRLAPALTPEERRTLFPLMVEDVLAAMAASDLDGVLVLTNEPAAGALAKQYGARVEGEPENQGQSEAVMRAMQIWKPKGYRAPSSCRAIFPASRRRRSTGWPLNIRPAVRVQ